MPEGEEGRPEGADREYLLRPIGYVASPLIDVTEAPKQGDEGAPEAWLVLRPEVAEGLEGLPPGSDVLVLTWLHLAQRATLMVHPRSDTSRPLQGVFSTRSPDRPNPVGVHRVRIVAIEESRIRVTNMEAVDGTPILDIKPVLEAMGER